MDTQPNSARPAETQPSSTASLVLAWLFVGVPLLWGVSQTFIKALALFQ
ncbi:MFS transporter small subunit [Hymenobacter koreensis]|uniref:Oxalate:formate antiporter n=1 Tax=Hymenobacter koreensis TaxID=1084523 RepID=A0ABP8IZC0_9BACT